MMPVLEVQHLEKRFGGLIALGGVSLQVSEATIFGIIGPNGAGKTTLFNVISGIERPQSGRVLLLGEDITALSLVRIARKGLTRTFQRSLPFGKMTTLENVLVAGYAAEHFGLKALERWLGVGQKRSAILKRAHELLAMAGLEDRAMERAEALSHGDLRRLEVARAVMQQPRVVMLDEPAAGLSVEELHKISDLLQMLRTGGTTVIIIEHNMTLMMNLCDRIAALDHGLKIAEGTPAQIQEHEAVIEAYFGRESGRA